VLGTIWKTQLKLGGSIFFLDKSLQVLVSFFLNLKMVSKKFTHQNHDDMFTWEKIRVLGALPILAYIEKVLPTQTSFINLDGDIFSKIVQLFPTNVRNYTCNKS